MGEPKLDIVFFDIDDTLYSTTRFAELARRSAVDAMVAAGLRVTPEDGFAELCEVVVEFTSNYSNHFARLLDRLGPAAYPDRNRAVLEAAGVVAYHQAKGREMHVQEDVREVLRDLASKGVRLGVISAGLNVKQAEKLIRLGVLDCFDPRAIFFSDQMGVSKPNPKIFQNALAQIGVRPERALYVGDRPSHDVAPARAIGMFTVHYTGAHGRHANCPPECEPHHTVSDLRQLVPILREQYGLPV